MTSKYIPIDMSYAKLWRVANDALEMGAKLTVELRGSHLIQYVLVKRAGGHVAIPQEEINAATDGSLQVMLNRETGDWEFVAVEPGGAEETSPIEVDVLTPVEGLLDAQAAAQKRFDANGQVVKGNV